MKYDPKKWDSGKYAEHEATEWLEARTRARADFAYHRYPDARSARNPIAAQPADFLASQRREVGGLGGANVVHIECKEMAEQNRLPRTKIRQYGKLKLFDWAGFRTVVLVFITSTQKWLLLDGHDLFDHEEVPASFDVRNNRTYNSAADALERIWP